MLVDYNCGLAPHFSMFHRHSQDQQTPPLTFFSFCFEVICLPFVVGARHLPVSHCDSFSFAKAACLGLGLVCVGLCVARQACEGRDGAFISFGAMMASEQKEHDQRPVDSFFLFLQQ